MTDKLKAPKLPDGYRFNLSLDADYDLAIKVQKRRRFLLIPVWSTVKVRWLGYPRYKYSLPEYVEANMVDMAGELIKELSEEIKVNAEVNQFRVTVSKMLGNYPPKQYLTED